MNLLDALLCASLSTGLSVQTAAPHWQQRAPDPAECAWTVARADCAGLYLPFGRGAIVAGSWSVLVHEACHALQHAHGLPFDEAPCYRAQAMAMNCPGAPRASVIPARLRDGK